MATIINSTPWTSQPQQAVGIDWGNPITRDLAAAFNYSGFDNVGGLALSRSGTLSVLPTSAGLSSGSSGTAYFSLSTRNIVAPTNTAFSVVGTFRVNNAAQTNKYIALLRDGGGAGNQAAVIFGYVANKIEFFAPQFTGSDPRSGSQITISDTNPHTFAYCYDGSNWSGYIDGVQVFSVSRTFSCNVANTNLVSTLLSANGSNTLDGSIIQWSTFNRGLSPSEARSLTANPWQIFKPLPRRIFVPVSAGGGLYTLTAQSGSYTVTGQQATVLRHRNLTASTGTYNITGQSVNITYSPTAAVYTLTAQAGSYSITGRSATLLKSKLLSASSGSYSIIGNSATISKNRVLTATSGSYTITGRSATLTYVPLTPVYTLTAQTGVYNITGQTTQLLRHRLLSANSGTYTYTGQSISINKYTAGSSNLVKYFDVLAGNLLVLKPLGYTGGGSVTATWGDITGILSAQTDLQSALDAKADSGSVPAQFNPIAGTNVTLSGTYPNITFNATGGGGTATQKQVTLDFGSVPSYSKAIVFTDAEITPTSKIVMTAHAESDELEMDGFVCSVQCGSGTATAYIHAVPGPVTGQRKFNYLIG